MNKLFLSDASSFPPAEHAADDGIVAVGGSLSQERLLDAYSHGIFPWYSDGLPVLWHSPDPRFVLFPNELTVSKSTRQVIARGEFDITFDTAFGKVIRACSETPRVHEAGTWITQEMIAAYESLYTAGFAHSVEAWKDNMLAGGLYGVSLGRIFFGESMFYRVPNASKAAFVALVHFLKENNFELIDSQVYTDNMARYGAREISRTEFLARLKNALQKETLRDSWTEMSVHKSTLQNLPHA